MYRLTKRKGISGFLLCQLFQFRWVTVPLSTFPIAHGLYQKLAKRKRHAFSSAVLFTLLYLLLSFDLREEVAPDGYSEGAGDADRIDDSWQGFVSTRRGLHRISDVGQKHRDERTDKEGLTWFIESVNRGF